MVMRSEVSYTEVLQDEAALAAARQERRPDRTGRGRVRIEDWLRLPLLVAGAIATSFLIGAMTDASGLTTALAEGWASLARLGPGS